MLLDRSAGAVVVTGATGVVGRALLGQLGDVPVIALTHRQRLEPRTGLRQISCDLTSPGLGLEPGAYSELVASTRAVVHVAAVTDFNADPARVRQVNLAGTRSMVELARSAGAVLHHVSSAFVDRFTDAQAVSGTRCADGRDTYLRSKIDCEELLRSEGHPHTIVRPSLLIGDTLTGAIHRPQGLHAMLGAYCFGALPFLPFHPATTIDFVPQDAVARALTTLIESDVRSGEYWLTAGPDAMSVNLLTDTARMLLAAEGGRELDDPRYFDIETLERLILPAFLDCFDQKAQRLFQNLVALASLFPVGRSFPSDFGHGPLAGVELTADTLTTAVRSAVRRHYVPHLPVEQVA